MPVTAEPSRTLISAAVTRSCDAMLGEQTGRPDIEGDWIANAPDFSEFPSSIEDIETIR